MSFSLFKRKVIHSILGIFFIVVSVVSCSDFFPVEARSPVESEFIVLEEDNRILYKKSLRSQALLLQTVLDEEISRVEKTHGKPFVKNVFIHLCDTSECFAKYTGIDSGILAAVSSNGLFLKSYVVTNEGYAAWLAHELSHLHLRQHISTFKASFIPHWYQEGLATFASNGGGADKVSREKASQYFQQGKHFVATDSSSLLRSPWPLNYEVLSSDWALPWYQQHMNYRQASLFYEYLHPIGGIRLIRALEKGESFDKAFVSTFQKTPEEMFELFLESISLSD